MTHSLVMENPEFCVTYGGILPTLHHTDNGGGGFSFMLVKDPTCLWLGSFLKLLITVPLVPTRVG